MTSRQEARFTAGKRVQQQTKTYATQLGTIADAAIEISDLNSTIIKLETAQNTQATDTTGKSEAKASLRNTMAETIVIYTGRAVVKAKRAGNTALATQLDHPEKYYTQTDATTSVARANATVKALEDNLQTLTNISPANIAEIKATITAFSEAKEQPTLANQHKKTAGTDVIEPLLDEMDTYIDHLIDLVHSYFPKSELANAMDLAAKLIITGTRHNSLSIHIQDAATQAPIAYAHATDTSTLKTEPADATGLAHFEKISTGNQTLTIAAAGYTSQTITAKIARGTNTDVVVKLVKA
ncbi:MAG: hypothetical protein QM541_10820 [Flavobacterium sp.]|nr:hypothetical protein [Flavobacterium sp.]